MDDHRRGSRPPQPHTPLVAQSPQRARRQNQRHLAFADVSAAHANLYGASAGALLEGVLLPAQRFEVATGEDTPLDSLAGGWLVIYCYPGAPQQAALESHLQDIREHEAFASRIQALHRRGVNVVALSSQPVDDQIETVLALELQQRLLFDPDLSLAAALALPTEAIGANRYYRRQTLIVREHRIEHLFFPVTDAAANPDQVQAWMLAHGW